jgi:hypothetical protein
MQVEFLRSLAGGNNFLSYVDAIGTLDGKPTLLEWKTTAARYPEEPEGLIALDPQLICYSWISGISDVAVVAFVRKRFPEIQYLKGRITDEQRREFGHLVEATASQIAAGQFIPHSATEDFICGPAAATESRAKAVPGVLYFVIQFCRNT